MAYDGVAAESAEVSAMKVFWDLVAALMGGTFAMRQAGSRYLPCWPNEEPAAYQTRLSVSTLFPGFKRTVSTLSGKPFTKPLTYEEDVPAELKALLEKDCDTEGRDLHTFAADLLRDTVGYGLQGILVDYPKATVQPGMVRTQADETALKLRPYLVHIKAHQVLGWKAERRGDKTFLTQLRLKESAKLPDGEFGEKSVARVRVLEPGNWRLFEEVIDTTAGQAKSDWVLIDGGTTSLAYIPFIATYGEREGFMMARPPLLELAYMNVEHWQSASDQQNILHVARVPILVATGIDDPLFKVNLGASSCVKLPTAGSDLKYVEHTGSAIGAGTTDLQNLEERMRQAGAELLIPRPSQTTATQVQSENAVGASVLQTITQGVQDALNLALDYMAEYMGNGQKGGKIKLFNDYAAFNLTEQSVSDLLKAEAQGVLSAETVFEELQRRGLVDGTKDWEEEKARLESQGPALGTLGPDGMPIGAPPTIPGIPPAKPPVLQ